METNKILNADLLDIIFDGKNKSYGAYELRKSYNSRLTKALIFTGALLLLIFVGTVFANILDKYKADKGQFDVVFEASGSAPAFMNALDVVRARGVVVVVGVGAEVTLPLSQIVAKEVDVRGTFRFHSEFATAVRFLNDRLVDGRPVITGTQPLSAAVAAFDMAADKSKSLKVQIAFEA